MTRVLIDACVLYPTVLREIVLGTAATGAFIPLWSERILEEWRRAAMRQEAAAIAEAEIAAVRMAFPESSVTLKGEHPALSLPDPDDLHVLAAAIDGQADELLTLNLKDFPTRVLSTHGIIRRDPDHFLLEMFHAQPRTLRAVVSDVIERAQTHGIDVSNPRGLLKRARLPRVGKALFQV